MADQRTKQRQTVWKHSVSITIADSQASGSAQISLNGTIKRLIVTLPDLDTDTSAILTIDDEDGNEIFNSNPVSDNQATRLSVTGDVCGPLTFTITCTTPQTGAKACTVSVYMKE